MEPEPEDLPTILKKIKVGLPRADLGDPAGARGHPGAERRLAFAPFADALVRAPAKVNLTLRVIGRRPDGCMRLDSLVAFAGFATGSAMRPRRVSSSRSRGRARPTSGPVDDNLVLRAARAPSSAVSAA